MFENNVRFDTILHIQTLQASVEDSVSEEFQDFLNSSIEKLQRTRLEVQCPSLKPLMEQLQACDDFELNGRDIAQQLAQHTGEFDFLIQIEAAIPHRFKFDKNGEYLSNATGGMYYQVWILAKDMIHASEQSIKFAENIFEEKIKEAKIEQGFA